jgi:hypothetical protein
MVIEARQAMLQAASSFERAATLLEPGYTTKLPRLLFRGRAAAEIVSHFRAGSAEAMRGVAALEPLGAPLEDVRTGVRGLLDEIDVARHDMPKMREYTAQTDVPGMLRIHADRLRLRTELDALEPAVARQRMRDELDAIARVPDEQLTPEQVWRVGVITGLPEHQRPVMPHPASSFRFDESAVRNWGPQSGSSSRMYWHHLRLDLQRRELIAAGAVTRESLDAELRAIIAHADEEITPELNDRLSLIAGMPDGFRPALADVPMPWPLRGLPELSAWNWLPAKNQDAQAKYTALRMAVDHEQFLAANPTYSRADSTAELMDILALPDERITPEQFRRTSWLLRLPEAVRPDIAALPKVQHGLGNLGIFGYHPAKNMTSAKSFELLRVHLAAKVDPERAAAQLKARLDAGERIDMRIVAALEGRGDLLERAGITSDVLRRQAIAALHDAGLGGSSGTESLRANLEHVRLALGKGSLDDPATGQLRRQAIEIADRNIARMTGARRDTFGRHPDYAEIGRLVSITDLLEALAPSARPAAANAVQDAAGAAEQLAW